MELTKSIQYLKIRLNLRCFDIYRVVDIPHRKRVRSCTCISQTHFEKKSVRLPIDVVPRYEAGQMKMNLIYSKEFIECLLELVR